MPVRRFKAQETTTYRDLQATMKRLGATSLRVSPRDLLNPKDNQAEIIFDRGGRRYAVRCKKWGDWLDNLRAAERCIYYLHRAIEEYGVITNEQRLGEAFAGFFLQFEAPPDDTVLMLGSGRSEWWEVLGVRQDATKGEVVNAFRALARIHHPDTGGNADDFKRIRDAYERGIAALGS
jgi:DnaJ-domain-containing protein 1